MRKTANASIASRRFTDFNHSDSVPVLTPAQIVTDDLVRFGIDRHAHSQLVIKESAFRDSCHEQLFEPKNRS